MAKLAKSPRAARRVLVLLTTFNGERWIREQIDSILGQVGVEVHIVVRDDGSQDNTLRILQKYASKQQLRLLPDGTPTGSAAQNFFHLIRETCSESYYAVALADQDDFWRKDKLLRGCKVLEAQNCNGYSSAVIAQLPNQREYVLRQCSNLTRSDFLFEGAGQGCTFVLNVDLYERIRSFLKHNQKLTENIHYHDWTIYALSRCWKMTWSFDQHPTMQYRQHGNNDTGARVTLSGVLRRFQLLRGRWYATQVQLIGRMCEVAVPGNLLFAQWNKLLVSPRGVLRRARMVVFCLTGGRRRLSDKGILVIAATLGWL